jgi:hypothetical protein
VSLEYKIRRLREEVEGYNYDDKPLLKAAEELLQGLEEAKLCQAELGDSAQGLVFLDKPRHTLAIGGVGVVYFDPIKTD